MEGGGTAHCDGACPSEQGPLVPDEVLLHVFRNLRSVRELHNVMLVSRSWMMVASEPSIWRELCESVLRAIHRDGEDIEPPWQHFEQHLRLVASWRQQRDHPRRSVFYSMAREMQRGVQLLCTSPWDGEGVSCTAAFDKALRLAVMTYRTQLLELLSPILAIPGDSLSAAPPIARVRVNAPTVPGESLPSVTLLVTARLSPARDHGTSLHQWAFAPYHHSVRVELPVNGGNAAVVSSALRGVASSAEVEWLLWCCLVEFGRYDSPPIRPPKKTFDEARRMAMKKARGHGWLAVLLSRELDHHACDEDLAALFTDVDTNPLAVYYSIQTRSVGGVRLLRMRKGAIANQHGAWKFLGAIDHNGQWRLSSISWTCVPDSVTRGHPRARERCDALFRSIATLLRSVGRAAFCGSVTSDAEKDIDTEEMVYRSRSFVIGRLASGSSSQLVLFAEVVLHWYPASRNWRSRNEILLDLKWMPRESLTVL